jgi:hypothetical protein
MKITVGQLKQIIREEIQNARIEEAAINPSHIKIVKSLMAKYKNANGTKDFSKFAEDLKKALPNDEIETSTGNPNWGVRNGFMWAVHNNSFPQIKKSTKGTPKSEIFADGGPDNNWSLHKW